MLSTFPLYVVPFVTACCTLAAQSTVTGRVQQQRGDTLTPVTECTVFARSKEAGPLVGEYPDGEGRFVLGFPPDSRVTIGTICPNYQLLSVNGRRAPMTTFDCSQPGLCAEVEIILEPRAVVEGHVVDQNGMPVEGMRLELLQGPAPPRSRTRSASSDDRGYFRFFHLPPGEYELFPAQRGDFAQDLEWEGDPQRIELRTGDVRLGVQVRLRLVEGVELTGRIEGLPPGTTQVLLMVTSIEGRSRTRTPSVVQVDSEGRFRLPRMPRGKYELQMALPGGDDGFQMNEQTFIGTVDLATTTGEATFVRREPTRLKGAVDVKWPERDDLPGLVEGGELYFRLARGGPIQELIHLKPPDYGFDRALMPGRYRVLFNGPGPRVERRLGDGRWEPFTEVDLQEGETVELALRVRFEMGRLTVMVKSPAASDDADGKQPATHYVVGIRRNGITRLFPTDQHGRLVIDHFRRGDYEICAWRDLSREDANKAETWRKAGAAVRSFSHEDGVDMEITLTVAP